MRVRVVLSVALLTIGGAGLAAAAPASAFTQLPSSVALTSTQASLTAKVLITASMTYSCNPAGCDRRERQRHRGSAVDHRSHVATGGGYAFASADPMCDGANHTVTVQVLPSNGKHFHVGAAIAQATFGISGELNGNFDVGEFSRTPWEKIRLTHG
jgi:hypothetical protein